MDFYRGKKVLVTGHTGFKGSWLCVMLKKLGAEVTGYALEECEETGLYHLCGIDKEITSVLGDVRDYNHMLEVFQKVQPEIVFHLAAQPIVRESYANPVYTYDVNVMGTVHVMECIRQTDSVKSVVNVTTDKVYYNDNKNRAMKEDDILNGVDPYSNSKSCSELVTSSYIRSFFENRDIAVSTLRAGNVIGGGDFAKDRIIPDCYRAMKEGTKIVMRKPDAIRPFQHVLEPLNVYLFVAQKQYEALSLAGSYNVGPEESDCVCVQELVECFCEEWKEQMGDCPGFAIQEDNGPKEAQFLKLDCSRLKKTFNWMPAWDVKKAVRKTVEWYVAYIKGMNVRECMERQIGEFYEA